MAGKLFGTDGVRGVAGEFLTAELALALGQAATRRTEAERPQVLIIRDTRESGAMLQSALAAGVCSAGGDALLGGVLPTPAAPLLIRRYQLDLAAVISASHNPYQDNGIKFFAGDGYKLWPPIVIPIGATDISIATDGTVVVMKADATSKARAPVTAKTSPTKPAKPSAGKNPGKASG